MTRQVLFTPQRATEDDILANASPGATAQFFVTGTTTPIAIQDVMGNALPNPLTSNSAGVFTQVVYSGPSQVKCVIRDADGGTLYTIDPCPLFDATGSAAVSVTYQPNSYLPQTNVQDAIDQIADILQGVGTPLRFGDGTQGAPSISFLADEDTGFYRVGANEIGFSAGGTVRASLTTLGLRARMVGSAADPSIYFRTGSDRAGLFSSGVGVLNFSTAGTERMRISSAGNVGIGLTNPAAPLHVSGEARASTFNATSSANGGFVGISADSQTEPSFTWSGDTGTGVYLASANQIGFTCNGTEVARISSSGLRFDQEGTAATAAIAPRGDADTGIFWPAANVVAITAGGSELARFASGSFRVGQTGSGSPGVSNTVVGFALSDEGVMSVSREDGSSARFNTNTSGTLVDYRRQGVLLGNIVITSSDASFLNLSDERRKENIIPASDPGSIIDAIEVVEFDWISSDEHVRFGVIAQQMNGVFPEAVIEGGSDPIEQPWGYAADKLVPMLLREIQLLRQRVAALEGA